MLFRSNGEPGGGRGNDERDRGRARECCSRRRANGAREQRCRGQSVSDRGVDTERGRRRTEPAIDEHCGHVRIPSRVGRDAHARWWTDPAAIGAHAPIAPHTISFAREPRTRGSLCYCAAEKSSLVIWVAERDVYGPSFGRYRSLDLKTPLRYAPPNDWSRPCSPAYQRCPVDRAKAQVESGGRTCRELSRTGSSS